jgi:hypothetical protein
VIASKRGLYLVRSMIKRRGYDLELIFDEGSSNGVGVGYMLVQHKPELGNRRVKSVESRSCLSNQTQQQL